MKTMLGDDIYGIDDFPIFPGGNQSTSDYFSAFFECKELVKKLPAGERPDIKDQSFSNLLKEILLTKNSDKPPFFRKKADVAKDALILLWLS